MVCFPQQSQGPQPDLQKDHPPQKQKQNYTSMLLWSQSLSETVKCV